MSSNVSRKKSKRFEITDILTPEGIKALQVDQVLMFDYEGKPIHLRIVKKARGRVWAKYTTLRRPEDVDLEDQAAMDDLVENLAKEGYA